MEILLIYYTLSGSITPSATSPDSLPDGLRMAFHRQHSFDTVGIRCLLRFGQERMFRHFSGLSSGDKVSDAKTYGFMECDMNKLYVHIIRLDCCDQEIDFEI